MKDQFRPTVEIHVAVNRSEAAFLESSLRGKGYAVIHVDLTGVNGRNEVCDRIGKAFRFPYAVTSLDAAVDLASDLEWLGNPPGYLVEVTGVDQLPNETLDDAVGLLPAICDRWRSQHRGFVVLLTGWAHRSAALSRLSDANGELSAAAGLPWVQETKPVPIVDHAPGSARVDDDGEN
jgi:hypothetical protein